MLLQLGYELNLFIMFLFIRGCHERLKFKKLRKGRENAKEILKSQSVNLKQIIYGEIGRRDC